MMSDTSSKCEWSGCDRPSPPTQRYCPLHEAGYKSQFSETGFHTRMARAGVTAKPPSQPKLFLHPNQWEDFKAAGYDMSSFELITPVAQEWKDEMVVETTAQLHSIIQEIHGLKDDPVNHPKHYNDHPSGVECITITRHMGFNIGNAIKYLWRAGRKDKDFEIQDLKKAVWYIQDEIKRLEANDG